MLTAPNWIIDLVEQREELIERLKHLTENASRAIHHKDECEAIRTKYQTIQQRINAWASYNTEIRKHASELGSHRPLVS